jgi:hypothetical protein
MAEHNPRDKVSAEKWTFAQSAMPAEVQYASSQFHRGSSMQDELPYPSIGERDLPHPRNQFDAYTIPLLPARIYSLTLQILVCPGSERKTGRMHLSCRFYTSM